ncbi:hypothetical protein F4811DRAFT_509886 [Daldinia bambusicola]|nr:hypothetical protein F4811DRAFT_509886 [Daldinia bambusicola]
MFFIPFSDSHRAGSMRSVDGWSLNVITGYHSVSFIRAFHLALQYKLAYIVVFYEIPVVAATTLTYTGAAKVPRISSWYECKNPFLFLENPPLLH